MFDDEISSLVSLLGLLEPSEYFITVDNSALWQKHISWAKSKGEDLRSHITQRYASSMVFLSCLLAAQVRWCLWGWLRVPNYCSLTHP
jgi:hypothetical protein